MKIFLPFVILAGALLVLNIVIAIGMERPAVAAQSAPASLPPRNLIDQTHAEADAKSVGCLACHHGIEDMHNSPNVVLGCADCHGGNATAKLEKQFPDFASDKTQYDAFKNASHVQPLNKEFWKTSANPANSTVAAQSRIAAVHPVRQSRRSARGRERLRPLPRRRGGQGTARPAATSIDQVTHSMMNHGAMLWAAAAYNNGAFHLKNPLFGQDYSADGEPLALLSPRKVTARGNAHRGLPADAPPAAPLRNRPARQHLPRLRKRRRAGRRRSATPIPTSRDGKPMNSLSDRGLGTNTRIDPTILNAQKTRLHDPLLGFMGSNDHPGDYRSSGCTACHVIYANDRSPTNSGWYAKYGNQGLSFSMRPDHPQERARPSRSSTSSPPPSRAASA